MCGIILFGSSTPSFKDIDTFEKLLFCDVFRGAHATGVFSGHSTATKPKVKLKVQKDAVPSPVFLNSKEWEEVSHFMQESIAATSTQYKVSPKFLVGHNRYSTVSGTNDDPASAHPFQHGHITLVHNGSLANQSLLPDSHLFKVDSENVCYSIYKIGLEETLKKLHGAFTLVWHDANNDTLNIIRNSERPFTLARVNEDWYGASEGDMLKWILERGKYSLSKTYTPISEMIECKVGTQYIFDVSKGKFELKEEVEHTLPKFVTQSQYSHWGYYTRPQNRSVYMPKETGKGTGTSGEDGDKYGPVNTLINSHGLAYSVGDYVKFETIDFTKYAGQEGLTEPKGKITGYYIDSDEYVEVIVHTIQENLYRPSTYAYGKIVGAYESQHILTLVVSQFTYNDPRVAYSDYDEIEDYSSINDLLEEDEERDVQIQTQDGAFYTKKEWDASVNSSCGWCSSQISFEDASEAQYVSGGFVCGSCYSDMQSELYGEESDEDSAPFDLSLTNYSYKSDFPIDFTFVCSNCAREKDLEQESDKPGCCIECFRYMLPKAVGQSENSVIQAIRKKLDNGMNVNMVQWYKINKCGTCESRIPWDDADKVSFMFGSVPLCVKCNK